MKSKTTTASLIVATLAAISASLCCMGSLALLAFGMSGAWVSTLTHLEFLRPIGITVVQSSTHLHYEEK